MDEIKKENPEITKEKLFYIADNYYKLNSHDMENKIKAAILKELKDAYVAIEISEKPDFSRNEECKNSDFCKSMIEAKKDILYRFFWITRMPLHEYINKFDIDDYIKNEYIKV